MQEKKYHVGAIIVVLGFFFSWIGYHEFSSYGSFTIPTSLQEIHQQFVPTPTPIPLEYSAWLPSFQEDQAFRSIGSASASISTILPEWYQVDHTGRIITTTSPLRTELRQLLQESQIRILPSFTANDPDRIHQFLTNSNFQNEAIDKLKSDAKAFLYAGIDLKFTNIPASESASFLSFLANLHAAMADQEQLLSVTVPYEASKLEERVTAFPFDTLSVNADEIRLFLVPFAGSNSQEIDPLPLSRIETIVTQATKLIPEEKLIIGIPLTGVDWDNRVAVEHTYSELNNLLDTTGTIPTRDSKTGYLTGTLRYRGLPHTLFIGDTKTVLSIISLVKHAGGKRISLWYISSEDASLWNSQLLSGKERSRSDTITK